MSWSRPSWYPTKLFMPALVGLAATAVLLWIGGSGPYLRQRLVAAPYLGAVAAVGMWCYQQRPDGYRVFKWCAAHPGFVGGVVSSAFIALGFVAAGDPTRHAYIGEVVYGSLLFGVLAAGAVWGIERDCRLSPSDDLLVNATVMRALDKDCEIEGSQLLSPPAQADDLLGQALGSIVAGDRRPELVEGLSDREAFLVKRVLARLRWWERIPLGPRNRLLRLTPSKRGMLLAFSGLPVILTVTFIGAVIPWPAGWWQR